ncbi:hypothetical protein NQ315_017358 [Exocentrus adspersus]|uniref:Tyr recombinase domain-containing protein n=1 Tax=Exocentrus adspersus TaxID=1586481 RepID=A0AAV8VLA9_9CUCU|nr:hypothetical protein NQ315_017358 [Exocentrus adspersus]
MESESEYSDSYAPPNITEAANSACENILPNKSRSRYELIYKKFMDWRRDNQINSFSENVLLAYISEISKNLKPPTVWSMYSMLRSTIDIKHNINISKYAKVKAFLKQKSTGYRSKKAKVLTPQQIQTFIKDAPDHRFLFTKVALIFGIAGACRSHELRDLEINNVQDLEKALLVTIPNTKTHTPVHHGLLQLQPVTITFVKSI